MTRARIIADYAGTGPATDLATQAELDAISGDPDTIPHIIPDVLYPAVANVMVDGSTSLSASTTGPNSSTVASSKYGTVQSDGRMYYYTDIKGSKPIKDPRIGAHFGSQRHDIRSVQILEQETATHGLDVCSVDGREWFRTVNMLPAWLTNDSNGVYTFMNATTQFFEVTGYFNGFNMRVRSDSETKTTQVHVDGVQAHSAHAHSASCGTPLGSRYVDRGSIVNVDLTSNSSLSSDTALGIHTIKITRVAGTLYISGIELIAQDTTSTATKSQIQIPSQNVVSYGKKFTVSGTPHYNPFAFKTDGSTAWASGAHNGTAWPVGTGSSANIDTATSLGLSAWVSTNYYKPYNGGRVVWWVDSSGTLKCSVNMMPPNARNLSSTASNEKGDDSAGTTSAAVANTQYLPTFTDQAIDHSQAEVAKTFHWREFGNGAANAGTDGTYADASMINTVDDIAYVMDDGLTSLSADAYYYNSTHGLIRNSAGKDAYITFIGTGFGMDGNSYAGTFVRDTIAQNLPYGTHILKIEVEDGGTAAGKWYIDGVEVKEWTDATDNCIYDHGPYADVTIHQPKMPPIPEDAVVIADYMLMADFVAQTGTGISTVSKGVRMLNSSRDIFYDSSATPTYQYNTNFLASHIYRNSANDGTKYQLPYFGKETFWRGYEGQTGSGTISEYINSTSVTIATEIGTTHGAKRLISGQTLGLNGIKFHNSGSTGHISINWLEVATPIHTSSHYQTFETPFLHELVGGDRNMEQTNLVVTADGKTWDEVTRDVSYIGNGCVFTAEHTDNVTGTSDLSYDKWRGTQFGGDYYNKDFAIGYDRIICLKAGQYRIGLFGHTYSAGDVGDTKIYINGTQVSRIESDPDSGARGLINYSGTFNLKRGDYITINVASFRASALYNNFTIDKV